MPAGQAANLQPDNIGLTLVSIRVRGFMGMFCYNVKSMNLTTVAMILMIFQNGKGNKGFDFL